MKLLGHWLQTLWFKPAALMAGWAMSPKSDEVERPPIPLPWKLSDLPSQPALAEAREAFLDALSDIDCREAACLEMRIRYVRSMQALWHLRTDVFLLVSLHRSQREALGRLETLNRHFPTRSPRSGFGALLD